VTGVALTPPEPSKGLSTTGPPPEGRLADFPLPLIFAHALSHRLSGSLLLRPPNQPQGAPGEVVVFADGSPTRVRTRKLLAPLGEMLVRLGVIANVDLDAALARAHSAKAMLGKQLVADSLVDRRTLLRALKEQTLVRVRSLGALSGETSYEFHANADLLEEGAPTNAVICDGLAAILALVREWTDRRAQDDLIAPVASKTAKLHDEAAIDRFELDDTERAIIARMSAAPITYGALLQSSVAPERSIRALLYTLLLTRHADDGESGEPLGVEPPSDPVGSLRDSSLNAGVDPLRTSAAIRSLGAADDYREAEALWRAGSLEGAEILARRAVERDDKPAHRSLLGVIIAQQGGRTNFKRGLAMLDEAIARAPRDDRSLVFRGTVLRDAGRFDRALEDFRAAAAANPSNAEARLALRRAESRSDPSGLRKSNGASSPAASGRTQWILLAILVSATIALLAVYLRLRH
jgi:tetratricopeptide (TPR) repeat protein